METQPSDDRAPEPTSGTTSGPGSRGRRLPRGAWFAIALAIVVLAIAAFQATGSSSSTGAKDDDVAVIDPNATEPTSTTNPLQNTGSGHLGKAAPTVSMTRFDGSPVTLADYQGTPLVVNFWAFYCGPCRTEMPDFEKVHQQLGDQVAFLGVDTAESIDQGRPFAEETGVTYDLASDPQGRLASELGVSNLPTTVLIRADGTIVRITGAGAVSADDLRDWIQQDLLS